MNDDEKDDENEDGENDDHGENDHGEWCWWCPWCCDEENEADTNNIKKNNN